MAFGVPLRKFRGWIDQVSTHILAVAEAEDEQECIEESCDPTLFKAEEFRILPHGLPKRMEFQYLLVDKWSTRF